MDRKRTFFIIAFILATLLLGYAIYRVFFASDPPTLPPGTQTQEPDTPGAFPSGQDSDGEDPTVTTPGTLPTIPSVPGQQGTTFEQFEVETQVSRDPLSGAALGDDGRARFYNQTDGRFYRVDPDGTIEPLTDEVFFDVETVVWSPTNNESIIEYPDGANIYYNFDTKKQVTLPQHWEDFTFAPQGDQIAAKSIGFSAENKWLVTSDPTGNGVTLVEPLGDNADKVHVDWSPNNQIIATATTGEPLGAYRQELLFVGQYGENFKSTIVEGRGLVSSWSPTGEKLLYSVYSAQSDFKPELWVVNGAADTIGSGRKLLGVQTWADKCTFQDDRFVYCGVPEQLQTGVGFAPELANSTPDQFVKIDTQTGFKTPITVDEPHVVASMFLSEDGETLYFTDKQKSGLFSVAL